MKKATGADNVYCFDHNIRRSTFVEQKNTTAKVQKPISQVHTDYTPTSAPRRLLDLTQPPKTNDSYSAFRSSEDKDKPLICSEVVDNCSRFCMINVWRNVSEEGPIQQYPLAVCAADTLKYPEDFVVFEIHYEDRIGENWFVRENRSIANYGGNENSSEQSNDGHHKWYYYPQMKKNEALIFKQWDSQGRIQRKVAKTVLDKLKQEDGKGKQHPEKMISLVEKTTNLKDYSSFNSGAGEKDFGFSDFCIHTAFEDPGTDRTGNVKVPDRESIEVRCFALFK